MSSPAPTTGSLVGRIFWENFLFAIDNTAVIVTQVANGFVCRSPRTSVLSLVHDQGTSSGFTPFGKGRIGGFHQPLRQANPPLPPFTKGGSRISMAE
jgi:hypothetical protein